MGESNGSVEVSVSFGRYENDDALSWEKWSSFSPNKYLEEAQKCKTSGSVAQKKAYFEAHYKKIAAQKMQQIEKEKEKEKEQLEKAKQFDEPHFQDHGESTHVSDSRFGLSEDPEEKTRIYVNSSDSVDERKDDASVDMEVNSLLVVKAKEGTMLETNDYGDVPKVEEQNCERGSQDYLKEIRQVDNEAKSSSAKKTKTPKPNLKNTARKVHPTTEDRISAGTKKKPVLPVTKSSRISTPTSKPVPTPKVISSSQPSVKKLNGVSYQRSSNTPVAQSNKLLFRSLNSPSQSSTQKLNGSSNTPVAQSNKLLSRSLNSTSQSSTKKLNGSTLPRSKNASTLENKRMAPASMHTSLGLGPPNSTASTMRKSLILERMGDRDIVKRAFKAFQNSFNQGKPEVDTRYGESKKVLPKGSERKMSASATPRKEVERLRNTLDKVITQKCQSGTRSNSLSSGAPKDAGTERKKANTIRPAGTRTDRSTDKLKEDITKGKIHRSGPNR